MKPSAPASQGSCLSGFVPADFGCKPEEGPKSCTSSEDCSPASACANGVCIDPCDIRACGPNSECRVVDHTAQCSCRPGYTPADFGCKPEEKPNKCSSNADCNTTSICANDICIDPCIVMNCGPHSKCEVVNHMVHCSCQPGYVPDKNGCKAKVECTADKDCGPTMACESNVCVDPCSIIECRWNEFCKVVDHKAECKLSSKCVTDEDCGPYKTCAYSFCLDPCKTSDCGPNSICSVVNHKAECSCKPGYTPVRFGCGPEGQPAEIYCSSNANCANEEACVNGFCVNPCTLVICGSHSTCKADLHEPICECDLGFVWNESFCEHGSTYLNETIDAATKDEQQYMYYTLPIHRIKFKLKSSKNGMIVLSDKPKYKKPLVKFGIGVKRNKKSGIEKFGKKNLKSIVDTPDILGDCEVQSFWISYTGGVYYLGKENQIKPIVKLVDPDPMNFNFMGVSGGEWDIAGKTVEIHGKHNYHFQPIPPFSLDIRVRANHDAQLALTKGPKDSSPMYEIFLGAEGNTVSSIRYNKTQPDKVRVDTPSVLTPYTHSEFRVSWTQGLLKVRVGPDWRLLMQWQDPEPFVVTHFGVRSPQGAHAIWVVTVVDE